MPDRPYSELRKEIFGGSNNTAQEASPSFQGMSYADFKANHLNQSTPNEAESSPFTSTVKSTSAGILNSLAGQPVEDIGKLTGSEGLQNFGKGVREYAEGVQKANPSQINSLGDIVDKPVTAVKTALGNLVPQVPLSMAGAYAGAKAGAALPLPANLKPIASAIGAGAGMFVPSYAQEYSEMRGKQNESGQEDIGKAALAAIPAAGLETAADYVGLGRLVPNGIAGDVLQEGASRLAHVGKQALKGAGAESGTEYLQTGLEQYGGNEDLTTDQAANERNVSAALGGIGGGVMRGGISAFDQRQSNVVPPEQEEAPKGPLSRAANQANVAPASEQIVNPALNPSGQAEQINPTVLQDEQPAAQPVQSATSDILNDTIGSDDAMVSASTQPVDASRFDNSTDNQEDTSKREEYVNNETGRLLDLITQNDKSPSFGNSVLLKLAKLNGVDSSQYTDPKVLLSDIASIHAERNKPQTANDVQYVSPVEDKPIDSSKPENLENRIHDETVITKVGNKSLEENEDQFIRRLMRNNRSHTYETAKEAFNKKLAQQQEINDNTARPETASTGTDSRNAITSIDETGDSLSGAASRDTDTTANSTGFSQQVNDNEKEKAQENIEVDADSARPTIGGDQSVDAQQGNGRGLDGELGDRSRNGVSGLRGGLSEGERYLSGELYSDTDNAIPDELTQQENKNENETNTSSAEITTETNVNGPQSAPRQSGRKSYKQNTQSTQQVNDELAKATESYPQVKALVDGGVSHSDAILAARDLSSGDDGMVKHLAKKHQIQLPEQEQQQQVNEQATQQAEETPTIETTAEETGKLDNVKQSWQMTSDEFANDQLNKSGYRKSYESDEKLKNDYLNEQKNGWKKALEERAQEGRLPDEVIDDFVDAYGQSALHATFRGTKEKGIAGWMPKDIREQESPKPKKLTVSEKPAYERTWQQHLSEVKKTVSRKLSRQELKEEQDNWNNAIIKAQNDGKQIPDAVIKNRDLIYAKQNEPSRSSKLNVNKTDNAVQASKEQGGMDATSSYDISDKEWTDREQNETGISDGNRAQERSTQVEVSSSNGSGNVNKELDSFAKNYRSYDNDKKEEIKQMMQDMVKTKKENGQPYQNLVDRIAIANQIDSSSDEVDTSAIYAERASGHPENQDHALTQYLVPIKINDTETASKKLDKALDLYSVAAGKLAKAKYDLKQAKNASAKKKAKAEITRLQDKEGIHEDSIAALRDETIPALERLYKEAKKKYGEEKQPTTSTVDDATTPTSNVKENSKAEETATTETPAAETTVKAPSQESNGELSYDELIARNKKEKQEKLDAIAPHENDAYESLSDTDKKFLSKRSGYFWKGEQYKDIAKHVLVDRDVRLVKEGKPNLNNLGSEPTEFEYKLSDGRRSSKVPSAVGRYIEALQGKLNEQADKTEQPTTSTADDVTTPTSREEQGSDTGAQIAVKQYPTEKAAKQAIKRNGLDIDTHEAVSQADKWVIKPKELRKLEVGGKVSEGEVVLSASGRKTTHVPKLGKGTVKLDKWLLENALAEAESRGDEFNARAFRSDLQSKSIPQASKDSAEEYLFGQQPEVVKSILKPLVQPKTEQKQEPVQAESKPELEQKETKLDNANVDTKTEHVESNNGFVFSDTGKDSGLTSQQIATFNKFIAQVESAQASGKSTIRKPELAKFDGEFYIIGTSPDGSKQSARKFRPDGSVDRTENTSVTNFAFNHLRQDILSEEDYQKRKEEQAKLDEESQARKAENDRDYEQGRWYYSKNSHGGELWVVNRKGKWYAPRDNGSISLIGSRKSDGPLEIHLMNQNDWTVGGLYIEGKGPSFHESVKTEEEPNQPDRDKLNSIFKQLGRKTYKSASAELKSEIDNHPDTELIKQVQKHWSDVLLDVGFENKEDSNKPNSKVFIEC